MSGSDVVSVRVPFRAARLGNRKVIITPEGASPAASARAAELDLSTTLLKALVRAWRWRRDIEAGRAASITEIAAREHLTDSFVGRTLALTMLAPNIVESLLDGRHPPDLTLQKMMSGLSPLWTKQYVALRSPT